MVKLPEAQTHPPFRRYVVLPLVRGISWLFFVVFGPYRVRGAYRVPKQGGVLILANHLADVDPPFVQLGCSRAIHFMAKSELFEMKLLGPILRLVGAFPVKRGEPDRAALKFAATLLKAGDPVCIFPEGQLSETGELQEIKPGVALIIRMTDAPVICLGLKHTDKIMPYGSLFPRPCFRTIEAVWGEPRSFTKDVPAEEILAWIEGQLRELSE